MSFLPQLRPHCLIHRQMVGLKHFHCICRVYKHQFITCNVSQADIQICLPYPIPHPALSSRVGIRTCLAWGGDMVNRPAPGVGIGTWPALGVDIGTWGGGMRWAPNRFWGFGMGTYQTPGVVTGTWPTPAVGIGTWPGFEAWGVGIGTCPTAEVGMGT